MYSELNKDVRDKVISAESYSSFSNMLIACNFAVIAILLSSTNLYQYDINFQSSITMFIISIIFLFDTSISYIQYKRYAYKGEEKSYYYFIGGFNWFIGYFCFLLGIIFLLLYVKLFFASIIIYFFICYNLPFWIKNIGKIIPYAYNYNNTGSNKCFKNFIKKCKKFFIKYFCSIILIPLYVICVYFLPFYTLTIIINTFDFLVWYKSIHTPLFWSTIVISIVFFIYSIYKEYNAIGN